MFGPDLLFYFIISLLKSFVMFHQFSFQHLRGKNTEIKGNLELNAARCCTKNCCHALLFILLTLTPTTYFYSHRVLTGLNLHYTEHTGLPLPPYEQWQAARWGRVCSCVVETAQDNGTETRN